MTAEHITPNDPRFERIGLTGYGDGLIYRPDEERVIEKEIDLGHRTRLHTHHVVRIGECWADVHGLDIYQCENHKACKALGLSGRIFGVRWWLDDSMRSDLGLKGRSPTWSERQEGVCVDTSDNDGEAMMVGMAHGVDAHNEAIGSPLVAGYCDECGGTPDDGCRCDDEPGTSWGHDDGEHGYWE